VAGYKETSNLPFGSGGYSAFSFKGSPAN
jgi:hypothetical protein